MKNDPYWTTARFDSVDAKGHQIKKGDKIFYYPLGKKAVCKECGKDGYADLMNEKYGAW